MTPQEKVKEWALSQVGYVPSYGKYNKYAEALDKLGVYNGPKNGYDWCDVFADSAYISCFGLETALKMINQPKGGCGAGCGYSASYYRSANQWSTTPSIGAQFFYGSAQGKESHTGIVVGFDNTYVYVVDGNSGYSQGYTGGAVLKHTYYRSQMVGYGVPNWSLAGGTNAATTQTNTYASTGKVAVDGVIGVQTVTAWQKWLGVSQTGSFSGQSRDYQAYLPAVTAISYGGGGCAAVKAIQKKVGAAQDGIMGPQTVRLLQVWLNKHCKSNITVDGKLGTQTAKAIQTALNKAK